MANSARSAFTSDVVTVRPDTELYRHVIELGDRNRTSIGLLTREAYAEHAAKGLVLAVVDPAEPENPFAYALYRLPRNDIALTHLVVADQARGNGFARLLVESLSERHPDRRGIRLRCRRDWAAHAMWPRLGFVPLGDTPGRSQKGSLLTTWWRDHGHANLMSWGGGQDDTVPVVIDANVFFDLHDPAIDTTEAARTRRILNDVLAGRVNLIVTPELHTEIDRQPDARRRSRLHSVAATYPQLAVRVEAVDRIAAEIDAATGRRRSNDQDVSDVRHVAYAAAGGVTVVITRDDRAVRRLRTPANDLAGVQLVTPEELVTLIDQLDDAPAYAPAALLGTGYSTVEAGAPDYARLETFLATDVGERARAFRERLRALATTRPRSNVLVVNDPSGVATALIGCDLVENGVLDVSLLRIRRTAIRATLAAQLLHRLRDMAMTRKAPAVRVSDPHIEQVVVEAALADGYELTGGHYLALLPGTHGSAHEAASRVATLARRLSVTAEFTQIADALRGLPHEPAAARISTAVALEHQLRPMLLTDAGVPCFFVPIRALWASELFGVPSQLVERTDFLGISVEHVYYRAIPPARESAPARILWYLSGGGPFGSAVIAWSHLVEIVDGEPDTVWRMFKRLGVYGRTQVRDAAGKGGLVRALRVSGTQVLDDPVPLSRYRALAASFCHRAFLQSTDRIPEGLFAAVVEEGTKHG